MGWFPTILVTMELRKEFKVSGSRERLISILCSINDYDIMTMIITEDTPTKDMVSKSQFKSRALEYFREVEKTRKPLIITDRGNPVLKLVAYVEDPDELLKSLRGSVLRYWDPTEPVDAGKWSTNR
jgi:antitoxin (DNA-binding transcriptional repressor) of toxin-antitoxin stability system